MNNDERLSEVQSPLQRDMVIAAIACFVSLLVFYSVARPAVELLEVFWEELLAYAVIPMSVTFIVLYRSCWHREIARMARAGFLFLLSGGIFVGVLFAIGLMLSLLWFCFNAVSGGNH
jgi:hypothetical protein